MKTEKIRIAWVDLAKGICILLMVALHTHVPMPQFLYNILMMPFFFIASGMFFNEYDNFKVFLKKKINSLIIPFLFFYPWIWIIWAICNYIQRGFWTYNGNFIIDIFGNSYLNNPIWYLICIFLCNLLYYFRLKK